MTRCITIVAACALLAAAGCEQRQSPVLTGRVTDANTGEPVADARIARAGDPESFARSGRDGYYVMENVLLPDTFAVTCGGYQKKMMVVVGGRGEESRILRNIRIDPNPDTAWTAAGPVDASLFLDNANVHRKKLSINEARAVIQQKFAGAKIYRGTLVTVSEKEEWLFELKFGRASASVYLDAYSGEISSIESDDPNMDRRLQEMIGR